MKICIATARPVGERCRDWAIAAGYEIVPMEECDMLVSVLYDKILPVEFLAGRKCFNFHPGVLPQYRGAGAYSWVIINGEKEAGVTLHEIDGDIDHGPIIDIYRFPIWPNDTAKTLYDHACAYIFQSFREWLPRLIAGDYQAVPQDEGAAGYYPRKSLEQAKDLTRYARAFHFTGKEQAFYLNKSGDTVYLEYENPKRRA